MGTIDFCCIIHIERCQHQREKSLTLNATLTVNSLLNMLNGLSLGNGTDVLPSKPNFITNVKKLS